MGIAVQQEAFKNNRLDKKRIPGEGDNFPMMQISYESSLELVKKLAVLDGFEVGRVGFPSPLEWEYASRAGSSMSRYGKAKDVAWYRDSISKIEYPNKKGLQRVGTKLPNSYGLYDTLGNICERCIGKVYKGGCFGWPDDTIVSDSSVSQAGDKSGPLIGLRLLESLITIHKACLIN